MAAPSLQEFMPAAKQANPGVSDSELEQYWTKTYGAAPGNATGGPALDVFLKEAKPLNPEASDEDLTKYWHANYGSRGAPEQQRGILSEIGTQAYAGATIDLPQMIGQAMEWLSNAPNGADEGGNLYKLGNRLEGWANQREQNNPDLQPQLEGRGIVGKALSMGARALAPSVATMVPAALAAPLDIPLAIAGAAGVGSFGLFGGSQAQQSYEAVKKAGGSEDDAKKAGWINFLIEGGGETAGTYFGAKLFGIGAKAIAKAGEKPVQAAINSAIDTQVWKPFVKQLPETVAVEAGTEFGQNYGEAKVEQAYGVQGHQPVQEGIQGGMAALGMTMLLAPFGLSGFAARARQNAKVADALQDPQSPDTVRVAASRMVYNSINEVSPEAAQAWARNSAVAIANKAPISLDDSFTDGTSLAEATKQSKDVSSINTITDAPDVDSAIAAATQAASTAEYTPDILDAVLAEAGQAPSLQAEVAKNEQVNQSFDQKAQQDQAQKDRELQAMLDQRRNIDAEAAIAQSNLPESGTQVPNQGTPKTALQIAFEKATLKRMEAMQKEKANAVQEQSAGAVDVRQPPGNGEGMGGSNAVAEQPAGEGQAQEAQAQGPGAGGNEVGQPQEQPAAQAPVEAQAAKAPVAETATNVAKTATPVDQAAHEAAVSPQNNLPEPTKEQILAGNAKLGHPEVGGMQLSIENPVGSVREDKHNVPPKWRTEMQHHYGYIKGTVGFDKDHLDVFVKPGTPEEWHGTVYVVNQNKGGGQFDEHKSMIGFGSEKEARDAYLANYSKGFERNVKSITPMPLEYFKRWAYDKTKSGPKGGEAKAPTVFGKPVEKLTRQELAAAAKGAGTEAKRAIAAAELERRDQEVAARPMSEAETQRRQAMSDRWKKAAEDRKRVNTKADSIIHAAIKLGGLPVDERQDITGEGKGNRSIPGVGALFNRNGLGVDEMARRLETEGYLTKDETGSVDGGVGALKAKIADEWAGRRQHYAVDNEEAFRAQAEKRAQMEQERAQAAEEAAKGLGEDLDLAVTPEDLQAEGLAPTGENLALAELIGRAAAADEDGFERIAMQHEGAPDAEFEAALVQFLKEREHADQRPNENPGQAGQAPGERPRVPEENRAPAQAEARPALELKGQTEDQIKAEEAARAKEAEAKRQKENAPPPEEFKLAGSNRPADVATAHGQQDLLAPHPLTAAADALRKAADTIEAAAKPVQKSGEISDFGEKIGGARKDVWSSFKDKMQEAEGVDIKAEPLSKSWPAPDYQALLDSGADPWIVGFIHAARDEIPTKPHASWKVSQWAESVKMLRDMASRLVNGEITRERVEGLLMEHASKSRGMLDLQGRAELYQLVGHEKSLAGVRIARGEYGIFEGKEYNPPKVIWSIEKKAAATAFSNWPRMLAMGDTKQAAMDNFKEKYNSLAITQPANKTISFEIYSKRGEDGYYIGKKIGRNPTLLEGPFKTVKEARAYKDEHHDDLVKKLERYKEIPNERRETNEPRVGEDMRNGQDVTPQMFGDAFGFRGVEFGNWVEQGKRQKDLNDAYDALMDMAAVLNVPPKALSLNGELGLAFGARGTGGKRAAAAHYESDRVVINLTKKEGAGSIGHEWWHALDNYFSRMRGAKSAYMTWNNGPAPELRPEMVDAFRKVVQAIRETAIKARSSKLDARRSKDYWTSGHEMSARAYESYLISKLQDQNASNDYLANIVDEATWKAAEKLGFELDDSYPYPTAGEIPTIRAAFDHFFSTVETKQTDQGIALHQTGSDYNAPIFYSELGRQIEAAKMNAGPPAAWRDYIRGLTNKGVKADEVQWSGVNDWLEMQSGKVTRDQVAEFLRGNGVRVEETTLGNSKDQIAATRERDALTVELDSLGYSIETAPDMHTGEDVVDGITDRKSGYTYPIDQEGIQVGKAYVAPENLDENGNPTQETAPAISERVRTIADRLLALEHELPTDETGGTRYSQYTLPGGSNYRELLLTLPEDENAGATARSNRVKELIARHDELRAQYEQAKPGQERQHFSRLIENTGRQIDMVMAERQNRASFYANHFHQPNILAHIRFNDRTDAEGEKVLFLEELQSDWGQRLKRDQGAPEHLTVPKGPFVGKTEAWVALALKRMIRYAAENGYDRVAWTTGEQQAARYDLSKRVSAVAYYAREDGNFDIEARKVGEADMMPIATSVPATKLADYVGKDLADKIKAGEGPVGRTGWKTFTGVDLKVGGEGMRAFYDKIVPNVANDVLKKLGGDRVGTVNLARTEGTETESAREIEEAAMEYMDGKITPEELKDRVGEPLLDSEIEDALSYNPAGGRERARQYARAFAKDIRQRASGQRRSRQPGFDVTPKLRESALRGMALFQPRSAYNPNQLDLIYDDAQTRPGTTQEQRSEGIAALKALFSRDRRAGASLLGSALWRDFQERKGVELIGQTARSNEDVAVLAQILRDPRFETLRFFFMKDGKIVGHTGVTSRLPGMVSFAPENRPELKSMMDNLGADGYYMLHNHPSGNARPSVADQRITEVTAKALPGFLGHVIIDHNQYATIDAVGESSIFKKDLSPNGNPELAHDALGIVVDSPARLGKVAKKLQAKTGYATMVSTNHAGGVMAIAEVPEHLLADTSEAQRMRAIARANRFTRMTGAQTTFVVAQNPESFDDLIKAGVVRDAIAYGGREETSRLVRDTRSQLLSTPRAPRASEFGVEQPSIANSATYGDAKDGLAKKASDFVHDYLSGFDKLSWWNKTVGTPFHIALTNAEFKPFYDEGQAFLNDTSRFANEAADQAQDLLPRVDSFKDFRKKAPSKGDVGAATKALYAGTLWGNGSPLEGRVWSDEELKSGRAQDGKVSVPAFEPLTDKQIALYRQALAATNTSLDSLGKSLIHRTARVLGIGFDRDMSLEDAAQSVRDQVDAQKEDLMISLSNAVENKDDKKSERIQKEMDQLDSLAAQVNDIEEKTNGLKDHGYLPAMRFGRYALHVTEDGKQLYFGMYESKVQALLSAKQLAKIYPKANIEKGVINKEQYRLFQGLSLDALETFADYITDENGNPISKDPLVQGFLKAAVAERSVLKRHIHRKGLAGFSEDLPRVLASFVTAGARAASSNYHAAEMLKMAQGMKAGDVGEYATKMFRYMMDGQQEAQALRGFLFAQYLGGSVASGLVNMTQPFMLTAPYLTQHTSSAEAFAQISKAAVENPDKLTGKIAEAYKRAKAEGIVAPQEIHQLRADTTGGISGRSVALRKLSFAWGSLFSLAEQFNRKTTFLAAYRIAEKNGVKDPYQFASRAVAETQFQYNRGNRPALFRGPVGATVGTFKVFSISSLELAGRLFKLHDKRPFAVLALVLLAAAGIEGLPFSEDIEDVIDTIGQWMGFATNSKKKLRNWATNLLGPQFAQVALHGMSGLPFMPIDVSRRLGYENLIPGTSLLKPSEKNKGRDVLELVGPVGQFLPTEDTMMGKALDRLANGDLLGIAKSGVLSRAVANLAAGSEIMARGEYRDIRGRKVQEVGPGGAAFKSIGLQPADVSRRQEILGEQMQDVAIQQRTESEIAEQWARGLADSDQSQVRAAIKRLVQWNRDNPDLPVRITSGQLRSRVKALRSSNLDRFVKTAPPEIRGGVRQALQ